LPDDDAFSHLSACFRSQDFNIASQNHTKIYQKCIRRRVRAVLTQQIFSSPKAFLAGHIGDMSKRKAAGIGQICMSKPTWFDSRSATTLSGTLRWGGSDEREQTMRAIFPGRSHKSARRKGQHRQFEGAESLSSGWISCTRAFCRWMPQWHRVTVFGDCRKDMKNLFKMKGYTIIEEDK
jgi:hypothetical protein